jgi:hypothetical protein
VRRYIADVDRHRAALRDQLCELGRLHFRRVAGKERAHHLEDHFLRNEPRLRAGDLTLGHQYECRHRLDAERGGDRRAAIDVDLHDLDLAVELARNLFDDRRLLLTRLAPVRVEVDQNRKLLAQNFLLEGRVGDVQDRHWVGI